jgi:hypothetical protein
MKFKVGDFRASETKKVDIRRFIPVATEPVLIRIKRYSERVRTRIAQLMLKGQRLDQKTEELILSETDFVEETKDITLLEGIVVNGDFPFERWDKAFIAELGVQCPEIIEYLLSEIREFNRPLADESEKKSSE